MTGADVLAAAEKRVDKPGANVYHGLHEAQKGGARSQTKQNQYFVGHEPRMRSLAEYSQ